MKKMAVPEWLLVPQEQISPNASIKTSFLKNRLRKVSFIDKTLEELTTVVRDEIFSEAIAGRDGLLQKINPAAKVVSIFILICVACLIRHIIPLLILNIWLLLLAYISSIPLSAFIKRVWLVVPLFTGIIVFPSIFNFIQPGTPLLSLFHFSQRIHFGPWVFPSVLAITSQGVWGAVILILRAGACISLAALLTYTTPWQSVLKALQKVFVPQIFVSVLEMSYRYIYLFLQSASEIFTARRSRSLGHTSTKEQRSFVSGAIGSLWSKAINLSEEIHAAMISRGYTGRPDTITNFRIRTLDWLWILFIVTVSALLIGGDRIFA